jgi:hypothetical protein
MINMNSKTLDIQKPNTRVVAFSYDLRFRCVIAHWKGFLENRQLYHQTLIFSIV